MSKLKIAQHCFKNEWTLESLVFLIVMRAIAIDTTDAVQVLKAQMDDMQNDSTRVAYQLASPSNRAFTARSSNPDLNGYNEERFDSMVRGSTYSTLLSGIVG